mgnify:FL=1
MAGHAERFLRAVRWLLISGLLAAWAGASEARDPNPRERIDFWQQNFTP